IASIHITTSFYFDDYLWRVLGMRLGWASRQWVRQTARKKRIARAPAPADHGNVIATDLPADVMSSSKELPLDDGHTKPR
ncbi:MAG: hypothetical protein KGL39_57225, partial [Patescibacteria group bacterium]|nr:hypothetical protein [Patescibacteria group bacterium]